METASHNLGTFLFWDICLTSKYNLQICVASTFLLGFEYDYNPFYEIIFCLLKNSKIFVYTVITEALRTQKVIKKL